VTASGRAFTAADSIRAVRAAAVVACAFGAAVLIFAFFRFLLIFPRAALLTVVLELPLLLIGYGLLRLLRPVRAPALIWSAAALIWGATAASGCALLANDGLVGLWAKGAGSAFAANWSASLSAPLNEEVLKLCGVILVVLAAPLTINGPLDGLIYGSHRRTWLPGCREHHLRTEQHLPLRRSRSRACSTQLRRTASGHHQPWLALDDDCRRRGWRRLLRPPQPVAGRARRPGR
jgi:hypothetical protein